MQKLLVLRSISTGAGVSRQVELTGFGDPLEGLLGAAFKQNVLVALIQAFLALGPMIEDLVLFAEQLVQNA